MLDEFKAAKIESSKSTVAGPATADLPKDAQSPPTADPAATKAPEEEVLSDDDFAKQLQAGMAELMGEIDNSVL